MTDRPLVTFVVLVYNQEEFVREAIISALAQTYSPLEIIVSDDASSDRSAAVVRSTISDYAGPHSIAININAENLGIGQHVNEMFRRARGELVVLAGGDDVSHPQRTSRVVQRWLENGKGVRAIYCGARRMDRHGIRLGHVETELETGPRTPEHLMLYKHLKRPLAIGACGAYSREIMRRFGDLHPKLAIEDIPLLVRASMLDGVDYIDEDLVDYRVSVSVWRERRKASDPFEKRLSYRKFYTRARLEVAQQLLRDALASGCNDHIRAANRGYLIHDFVFRCCDRQRMHWHMYFSVVLATGNWLYTLAAGLVDGHPRIHRFLYESKHSIASASRKLNSSIRKASER